MDADTRRFRLVLAGVVLAVLLAAMVWSSRISRRSDRFDDLAMRRATRAEFQEAIGRPSSESVFGGEVCWSYELGSNKIKMACFNAQTEAFESSSILWID